MILDRTTTSPTWVSSYNTPGEAYGVFVKDNYAYVADNTSVLRIIDVSDPANPTEVKTYNTNATARDVYVANGYVYVADSSGGLVIIQPDLP
jgi:hypothetical protein